MKCRDCEVLGKYEQMVLEWVKGGMNECIINECIMNECIIYEWMNEWVSEWVNEWMMEWDGTERKGWEGKGVEWMNDMNKCMNAWVNEWINEWIVLIDLLYSGIVLSVSFCHYMTWDEWPLICDYLMKYRLLKLSWIRILYWIQ